MSDKMREEFEAWAVRCNKAGKVESIRLAVTENGLYYTSSRTELLWQAWQASRAALVVELPVEDCETMHAGAVCAALDKAGVKYEQR